MPNNTAAFLIPSDGLFEQRFKIVSQQYATDAYTQYTVTLPTSTTPAINLNVPEYYSDLKSDTEPSVLAFTERNLTTIDLRHIFCTYLYDRLAYTFSPRQQTVPSPRYRDYREVREPIQYYFAELFFNPEVILLRKNP